MCTTCGCSDGARITLTDPATGRTRTLGTHANDHDHDHDRGHDHDHDHGHSHSHSHSHGHGHGHGHDHGNGAHADAHADGARHRTATLALERDVLAHNNRLAERNRGWLESRRILALNLVSSPGAGKTTLLERTIRELGPSLPISVVEGDQETAVDAERIGATGCRTVQVNTGTGCHLEAGMINDALRQLDPPLNSVVMIENVGNLVCPALFDLGERSKVVILSVTEGADKPLKYPHMFRAADLMIVNKIDLLPHVDFDTAGCVARARRVNPAIEALELSATTGEGLEAWYDWLRRRRSTSELEAAS